MFALAFLTCISIGVLQAQQNRWRTLNFNTGWQEYGGQTNGPANFVHWDTERGNPWHNDYMTFPMEDGPPDRGTGFNTSYLMGGDTPFSELAQKDLPIPFNSLDIDFSRVEVRLRSWLGGRGTQLDNAIVTVVLRDRLHNLLLAPNVSIGPVTVADRGSVTKMMYRETRFVLPPGSRYVDILVTMNLLTGGLNNAVVDDTKLEMRIWVAPGVGGANNVRG